MNLEDPRNLGIYARGYGKLKPGALRKIRRRPSFIMSLIVIIMGILFLAMKNEHPAAITFGVFIFSMGFILALGNYCRS